MMMTMMNYNETYRKNSTAISKAIASTGMFNDVRIIMIVTMEALGTLGIAREDIVVRNLKKISKTSLN